MSPVSAHYYLIFSTKLAPIDFSCLILRMRELKITQKADTQGRKSQKTTKEKFCTEHTQVYNNCLSSIAINKISNVNREKPKTVYNWLTFNAKLKDTAGPETSKTYA